jgi:hypothetical protein
VVFENGHCILAQQETAEDYLSILDEDVQKLAGSVLEINDTGIAVTRETGLSLCVENICGSFRVNDDHVSPSGDIMNHQAPRLGTYVEHRQFIGTHYLFNTTYGRLAYRLKKNIWSFKGSRSLEDLVKFVRDLTQDVESPMYPNVNMVSVTLRTNTHLVINPATSLMHRMFTMLYAGVVSVQVRTDDANNLFFLNVVNWNRLLEIIEGKESGSGGTVEDKDVKYVRGHLSSTTTAPSCSIGYTRKGVFFIRTTFPEGLVCEVSGSTGIVDGVQIDAPADVFSGGTNPFVEVVVRFILSALIRIRALG